jgi:hypothetical protein
MNEKPGFLFTKWDFRLQTGNLVYKTGFSFTNRDSWITNGIFGLLFTVNFNFFANHNDIVLTTAEFLHIITSTEVYAHGCNNKFEYPHG